MSLNPVYGTAKQFSFYEIGNSLTGLWETIKLLVKLVRPKARSIMSRPIFFYYYNIFKIGSNATLHVCCMSYYY